MLDGNVLWVMHSAATVKTEEDQEFRRTQDWRDATLRARGGQQPQEQDDEGMEQPSDEEDHSEGNSDISDEGSYKHWPYGEGFLKSHRLFKSLQASYKRS
jgi:hypothetical protein